jgi:serine/threonine protein phosphatase PrpC
VGVQPTVEVDVIRDVLEPGDIFLLCSDGLTARIADAEIGAAMVRYDHEDGVRRLVDMTLDRGAPDNVTVVTASQHRVTVPGPFGQAAFLS